mgnify:CR=1 FL=1
MDSKIKPLINESFFKEAGLQIPAAEQEQLTAFLYENLKRRVGLRLADEATPEQLRDFEVFSADDDRLPEWMEQAFPAFDTIVAEELAALKSELAEQTPNGKRAR